MAIACAEPDSDSLYSISQLRAIEASALANLPAGTLMRRAGHAVALAAQRMLATSRIQTSQPARILVAAGPGNNGGDAL